MRRGPILEDSSLIGSSPHLLKAARTLRIFPELACRGPQDPKDDPVPDDFRVEPFYCAQRQPRGGSLSIQMCVCLRKDYSNSPALSAA